MNKLVLFLCLFVILLLSGCSVSRNDIVAGYLDDFCKSQGFDKFGGMSGGDTINAITCEKKDGYVHYVNAGTFFLVNDEIVDYDYVWEDWNKSNKDIIDNRFNLTAVLEAYDDFFWSNVFMRACEYDISRFCHDYCYDELGLREYDYFSCSSNCKVVRTLKSCEDNYINELNNCYHKDSNGFLWRGC